MLDAVFVVVVVVAVVGGGRHDVHVRRHFGRFGQLKVRRPAAHWRRLQKKRENGTFRSLFHGSVDYIKMKALYGQTRKIIDDKIDDEKLI